MDKGKKAFGGYSINFKGCKDSVEAVFGGSPIGPCGSGAIRDVRRRHPGPDPSTGGCGPAPGNPLPAS